MTYIIPVLPSTGCSLQQCLLLCTKMISMDIFYFFGVCILRSRFHITQKVCSSRNDKKGEKNPFCAYNISQVNFLPAILLLVTVCRKHTRLRRNALPAIKLLVKNTNSYVPLPPFYTLRCELSFFSSPPPYDLRRNSMSLTSN